MPAAGQSRRLAPLPCSKELLPIGFGPVPGIEGVRPKVASQYFLEACQQAGIRKAHIVIRQGKWDIPAYWGDGSRLGMSFAYVVIEGSLGPPDTIDRAYPFVKENVVAFGFPDIIIRPVNVFAILLDHLKHTKAHVVLGVFPAHNHRTMDMVNLDVRGRIRSLELKPMHTRLQDAWVCAVWTPVFTEFMHRFLQRVSRRPSARLVGNKKIDPQGDLPVGAVLQEAIRKGIRVEGVRFPDGDYLDIGTPDALAQAPMRYR